MNGYSNAMQADLDTIKTLMEDQAKLKKSIQLAVNVYMEQVRVMNQDERIAKNKKSTSYSSLSL